MDENNMSYGDLVERDANTTIAWFEDKTADTYQNRQKLLKWMVDFNPRVSFIEMTGRIKETGDADLQAAYQEFNAFTAQQGHSGLSFGIMMRFIQRHYRD